MDISSLAFPYTQAENTSVTLNRLVLTDDADKLRYVFGLEGDNASKRCTFIYKLETATQLKINEPLTYIDNVSVHKTSPLLVRCDPVFHKMKLALSLKYTSDNEGKSLLIVKTKGHNDDSEHLRRLLESGVTHSSEIEISKLDFDSLPLDNTVQDAQKIVINDSYDANNFNGQSMNVFLFEFKDHIYSYALSVKLWINKLETAESPKKVSVKTPTSNALQLSDYRAAFSFVLDDGPEFRAILNKYEQSIPNVQKNTIQLIDELKTMETNLKRLVASKRKVVEIIDGLTNQNSVLATFKIKDELRSKLNKIFTPFESQLSFFLEQVCEKRLLNKIKSISTFEDEKNELNSLKKNFEHDSKEFYNWLKKYLSNEKGRPESKLLLKRKKFELSKFDYLNYLNNFSNNQYINEFYENLFKFLSIDLANIPKDLSKVGLTDYHNIYLNVLLKFNSEKYQLRQMIESCSSNDDLTNVIRYNSLTVDSASNDDIKVTSDNLDLIFSPVSPSLTTTTTVSMNPDSPSEDSAEKSGILYALGGKGKQGWHKEWVVVKNGELKEYSDWRTGNAPINTPIQIALSNVKPTTHDKRQYCFEIFTSSGNRYIFQAINEQERDQWIKVLDNARLSVNTDKLKENLSPKEHSKLSKKLNLKLDKPKPIESGAAPSKSPISVVSSAVIPNDYYKAVRYVPDSDNNICADCGSLESVEWVSINFLVVLCINCSSCHRSMGSHISRVKSLKMDNFNRETEVLLTYINNHLHNKYLQSTHKTPSFADYEERLEFIQNKYIDKKYAQSVDGINDLLFKSVRAISVEDTIKCVLLGADVNLKVSLGDKGNKILLFEYSLRKYLTVETDSSPTKIFVISEFLVLNGCKINSVNRDLELSEEAFDFWSSKYSKIA
ncbi:GTPase activating protein [Yamadazyma tenuis]|uniref:ADP-ribosylation factor GTPase-activating protein n=1 Tax=Candida tenuis (strain ATCC 10573 / BCRC 21748 / CBS 615 / JCM 9827 / NBRC 10315 / NRRL Y-1498 / VKM Y-70) TaxID=590646 RepID=G3BAL0_CANTC|nr:ArfGap-domain-containing protein [Yamadazyma tenuis ATCC 10573]EGV61432.1 ArfGap-domain-containing protein [Yamadazyma tenuis ATCC 10573]WEJ92649.1 GTPase activating protein [Yamadazyma tenuis]